MSGSESTAELEAAVQRHLESLTPEQRDALRAYAADYVARRSRVVVDDKSTSLKRFARRVAEKKKLFESGAMEETVRMMPRWQLQQGIPARELRQGAYKQQLRDHEEAELELDRFGQGVVTSRTTGLGSLLGSRRRDFAWGIYARTDDAERVMREAWAGRDQRQAVASEDLYLDIVRYCHQMELTLIALTSRPLPLAATRQQLAGNLEASMQRLSGEAELAPQAKADLQQFVSMFDDKRVAQAGWMDGAGNVREGTHFLFSATPEGHLVAEAITPGRLKERKTSRICVNQSPLVTASVFDVFLGPQPLDERGKQDVGHGMVWAANGFRFRPWEMRPGQYIAEMGPDGRPAFPKPDPQQEECMSLPLRPSVFQLLDEGTRPLRRMLLDGIHAAGDAS
ncbi:fatty-acid-binding 1 [Chlorella sorokiniana]|uniref:Fatty-acid-binding 1 n=1 Tax=Chlorella sorokiniana TaxID=3076 RepID=A0A2P6U4T0_CHLSO|nr:fatty-acid-binding 1 [Chlorella sorokiniana]|eukprot:PRW61320.1 fatty-acid-binding 1 [Chlorella sorokiniana]